MKTVIVGLGYVGLPLALQFCRSGLNVAGLDIDPAHKSLRTHLGGEVPAEFADRLWLA